MLNLQVQMLTAWLSARNRLCERARAARHDDRGEITSQTILIVLLAVAAITAGGVIAAKITGNANAIPSP
jgi:hypothetical protein